MSHSVSYAATGREPLPTDLAPRKAATKRRSVSSFVNFSPDMPKRRAIGVITSDGKQYPVKMMTPRAAKAALRPYSVELGFLATAWNQLHHNLSSLFSLILKPRNEHFAQAMWYVPDSDFLQRKMLRAIVETDQNSMPDQRMLSPLQAEEISWLLDQVDNKLRHKRNNALHAPLMILTGVFDNEVRSWVEAHFNSHNPRAKPLRGKDLIQEFREYTEHTLVLTRYATQIWYALSLPAQHPWPGRPSLPQAHKRKQTTHQGKPKLPPHLRGAS
jgi:integrase